MENSYAIKCRKAFSSFISERGREKMAHTEIVTTLFRRKTIEEECKIFLSLLMFWA